MAKRKRFQKLNKEEIELKHCIVSNIKLPREKMIRFVVGPDEEIAADIEARLPGRGFWLSARRDVIHTACTKNYFVRAAQKKIGVPSDLADRVERLLVRRCQDLIGLGRRAGQAVSGFTRVEVWLKSGKPAGVLLAAIDGAEDGRKKLWTRTERVEVIDALNGNELGYAFSRDRAVHVIVAPGRLAKNLLVTARRLQGLRC
jgi:predicted RNA-binding protein YlxR (DUF448 family)